MPMLASACPGKDHLHVTVPELSAVVLDRLLATNKSVREESVVLVHVY